MQNPGDRGHCPRTCKATGRRAWHSVCPLVPARWAGAGLPLCHAGAWLAAAQAARAPRASGASGAQPSIPCPPGQASVRRLPPSSVWLQCSLYTGRSHRASCRFGVRQGQGTGPKANIYFGFERNLHAFSNRKNASGEAARQRSSEAACGPGQCRSTAPQRRNAVLCEKCLALAGCLAQRKMPCNVQAFCRLPSPLQAVILGKKCLRRLCTLRQQLIFA